MEWTHDEEATPEELAELYEEWAKTAEPEAVRKVRCPICHAHSGQPCKGGVTHKRRIVRLAATTYKPGSVYVPGGAPFAERRGADRRRADRRNG